MQMDLFAWFRPKQVYTQREDELFRDRLNVDIKSEVDYAAIRDYAAKLMESYEKDDKVVDDKADSLLRSSGVGSVVVLISMVLSFKPLAEQAYQSFLLGFFLWSIPSVVLLFFTVVLAMLVRKPRVYEKPLNAREVTKVFESAATSPDKKSPTEEDKSVLNRYLISQYNIGAERTLAILRVKGWYLKHAYMCYALSILAATLPMIYVVYSNIKIVS
jgi:hypothetical protein